jgi:hypothetical protein
MLVPCPTSTHSRALHVCESGSSNDSSASIDEATAAESAVMCQHGRQYVVHALKGLCGAASFISKGLTQAGTALLRFPVANEQSSMHAAQGEL